MEQERGKISLIIPVHRMNPWLEKCITSAVEQTYEKLEILLVDDGLDDETKEYLRHWEERDERIRYLRLEESRGVSSARNRGFDESTGEYLAYLDSDDWLDEKFCVSMMRVLREYNCDIVSCEYLEVHRTETVQAGKSARLDGSVSIWNSADAWAQISAWDQMYSVVWGKLYRKNVMEGIRFPEGRVHEDEFVTWKCMIKTKEIAYLDAPLYYYNRMNEQSIMKTLNENTLDAIDALEEQVRYVWEHPEYKRIEEAIVNRYLGVAYSKLLLCGRLSVTGARTKEYYKKALQMYHEIMRRQIRVDQKTKELFEQILK